MSDTVSSPPRDLAGWLARLENGAGQAIELGLDRIEAVRQRMALQLPGVVITVAGTNGKGSTCAMLEAILLAAGYRVALYTSPHLVDFNERARVNGQIATDDQLLPHFDAVERARGEQRLTYFEFTTLAITSWFAEQALDVVILEVGLGGRLDAVNIFDSDCAIVTSIDLDHTEWLGNTREAIGLEKAHVFRSGKPAICADPLPPESLLEHAREIGADLWRFGHDYNYAGDRQQWSYGGRSRRRSSLGYPALRGANQLLNAAGALAALEALEPQLAVPQQAVRLGLLQASLPGRFQIVPGQPTLILDVAHNPHAAAVLAQNLDNMGFFPYTYAVFGMLADKDIATVVERLHGRIDHWYCAGLDGPRGLSGDDLAQKVRAAGEAHTPPDASIQSFSDPVTALSAVREHATDNDRIVVFGSFLTVAEVLSHGVLYAQPKG